MDERLYIVCYDIGDARRWRAVFGLMHGYGQWAQLSVFQCRLSPRRHAEMMAMLDQSIHHADDHVLVIDVGPAERVEAKVISLGKRSFEPVTREPLII